MVLVEELVGLLFFAFVHQTNALLDKSHPEVISGLGAELTSISESLSGNLVLC